MGLCLSLNVTMQAAQDPMAMLAEAANGAAAEWDAEHHTNEEERVRPGPGMAGRDGPRGSSSNALDAMGTSPEAMMPTRSGSPPAAWQEHEMAHAREGTPPQQVLLLP